MQSLIVTANRYKTRVCVNTCVCIIQRPRPLGYDVEADIGNNDEEDLDYVPSNDNALEDETMDTKADADIWLQDVKQPSSLHRYKGSGYS